MTKVTIASIIASIATAKTAELVAIFNEYSDKPVSRFADRKSAERRTLAVLEIALENAPEEVEESVKEAKPTLSESIAKSWTNPDVAAKRLTRHGVVAEVNGERIEFSSLRKAFADLRLPDSKHIAFRQILKAKGKATFNFGKASIPFELAEINEDILS